jgi:ABC-type thiamine transport system ATPase subunit
LITNKSLILVDELGSSVDQALAKKMLATLVKFLSSAELSSIGKN